MNGRTPPRYTPDDAFGLYRSYTRHIAFVRATITRVIQALELRALEHDASKLLDDEFAGFCRINASARVHKFGSPEYSAAMATEREVIDLHFRRNSHHAEHPTYPENIGRQLTFLDIIEMVCDWRGAQLGYDDHREWSATVELNIKTKGQYLTAEQLWLVRQVAEFIDATIPRPVEAAE